MSKDPKIYDGRDNALPLLYPFDVEVTPPESEERRSEMLDWCKGRVGNSFVFSSTESSKAGVAKFSCSVSNR